MRNTPGVSRILVALLAMAAPVVTTAVTIAQGRLRPPAFVTCDRNELTSFTGKVVSLTRQADATTLRMDTDERTLERFTVRHPGADPSAWFFVGGKPFTPADWAALLPGGTLRAGARATVWVCAGQPNPMVDWAPAEPSRP